MDGVVPRKKVVMLVGPAGSGKSTLAQGWTSMGYTYINQDTQGIAHRNMFDTAVFEQKNIIVDRMNFNKIQRERYLSVARSHGYQIEIIVLHQSYAVCLERMLQRENHPTIADERSARAALHTFFTKYERVTDDEADVVRRIWPDGEKPSAIVCDLDGTLCDVTHRRHFVQREGKKNWPGFFAGISNDPVNNWCADILDSMKDRFAIVYCSGRGQEHEQVTRTWFANNIAPEIAPSNLFMRHRGDSRQDYLVKEIILDFEILTRFKPHFMIDDRKQVVDMWRSRGFVCLQCDEGNF